jgi:hypothetical protein
VEGNLGAKSWRFPGETKGWENSCWTTMNPHVWRGPMIVRGVEYIWQCLELQKRTVSKIDVPYKAYWTLLRLKTIKLQWNSLVWLFSTVGNGLIEKQTRQLIELTQG